MTTQQPSPLSAIQAHKETEEKAAFQNYIRALRNWERARDRVDNLAADLQCACAELQQRILEGACKEDLAELRRKCRQLQEKHRRSQQDAKKGKDLTSTTFTALVLARNARLQFEASAEEPKPASIVPITRAWFPEVTLRDSQWN